MQKINIMGNVMSFIWNEFYIENKVKNKDCHLTGANIAYMNIDWIKFLLPLSSCFPQFKSQVLIAGNRAVLFSRDASMCLFAEEKRSREATTATRLATVSGLLGCLPPSPTSGRQD